MQRCVSVFLFAVAVFAGVSLGDVSLHPNCGKVSTVSIRSPTMFVASLTAYTFSVSCFGYAFVSNDGVCVPSTPGVLNFTITLYNGTQLNVPASELYRGSLTASTFRFRQPAVFALYAYYPDTSCPATLYHSIYVSGNTQGASTNGNSFPYLTSVLPNYMLPNQPLVFNLAVSNPPSGGLSTSTHRALTLPEGLLCSTNAAAAYSSNTPQISVTSSNTFSWTTGVTTNGGYRLCTWNSVDNAWATSALFQVFGGNPVYFKATTLSSTYSKTKVQLTFSGSGLNPNADSVAIPADDGTLCAPGVKSDSSVSLISLVNVDATHLAATVTISNQGTSAGYTVCYYAASTGTWASVPDFDTLTREVIGNVSSSNNTTTTAKTCTTAPYDYSNVAVTTNQVIAVTVTGSSLPSNFAADVATFLCITAAEVVVTRIDGGRSTSTVYFQVQCSTSACNGAERQAAFLANYKSGAITNLQSATAQTFTGIVVTSSSSDTATQIGLGVGLGVALLIIIILAVVVGVLIKRRRAARDAAGDDDEDGVRVVQGHVIQVNPVLNYPYPPPQAQQEGDSYANSPIPSVPEKASSNAAPAAPMQREERDL